MTNKKIHREYPYGIKSVMNKDGTISSYYYQNLLKVMGNQADIEYNKGDIDDSKWYLNIAKWAYNQIIIKTKDSLKQFEKLNKLEKKFEETKENDIKK
ncbi:MAG TPA: hypothetical protein HA284_03285 [Nanoarchaeota archaeon]|nr:MAG: hypothetical protein QJ16_C0001G0031 [archaeon GW2011_AR1]HIH52531.1 hypothetical protein [Nanoarchaeota archaeon]